MWLEGMRVGMDSIIMVNKLQRVCGWDGIQNRIRGHRQKVKGRVVLIFIKQKRDLGVLERIPWGSI